MRLIDRILFVTYGPRHGSLVAFRVIVAAYVLLAMLPRYAWIGAYPDAFFSPPLGVTLLFPGFPPAWFFHALDLLAVVAAVSLIVGHRARASSLALGGVLLLGNAWLYSLGKIDHDILIIVVLIVMAFSGWGRREAGTERRPPPAWPSGLLALLVALAMASAAIPKVLGGWLDPSAHATLGHVLHYYVAAEQPSRLAQVLVANDLPGLWKGTDYGTIVVEVAFLAALPWRAAFRLVCAVACVMHLAIMLTMDITFASNVIAYAAFVDWDAVLRRPGAAWARWAARGPAAPPRAVVVALVTVGLYALYATAGNPWGAWLRDGVVLAGAVGGAVYLLRRAGALLPSRAWDGEHAG